MNIYSVLNLKHNYNNFLTNQKHCCDNIQWSEVTLLTEPVVHLQFINLLLSCISLLFIVFFSVQLVSMSNPLSS